MTNLFVKFGLDKINVRVVLAVIIISLLAIGAGAPGATGV